jgi:hypothetical protein
VTDRQPVDIEFIELSGGEPRATTGRGDSKRPRLFGFALMLCAGWLVAGCSYSDFFGGGRDDDAPSATATAGPDGDTSRAAPDYRHRYFDSPPGNYDPDALEPATSPEDQYLQDLADQWADTDTAHFDLDIDGKTYLDADENIELKSAEGDLKRPDQVSAKADVGVSFASFDVDLIVIGDDAYMTNFLNGDWERAPSNFDFNPALIFDDDSGIGAILEEMDDARIGGESQINGHDAVEISGTVPQGDVSKLVAGALEGDEIGIRLWMDAETSELLRISLSEPDDVEGDPTSWIITFSKHGAPVTIEAPDL